MEFLYYDIKEGESAELMNPERSCEFGKRSVDCNWYEIYNAMSGPHHLDNVAVPAPSPNRVKTPASAISHS